MPRPVLPLDATPEPETPTPSATGSAPAQTLRVSQGSDQANEVPSSRKDSDGAAVEESWSRLSSPGSSPVGTGLHQPPPTGPTLIHLAMAAEVLLGNPPEWLNGGRSRSQDSLRDVDNSRRANSNLEEFFKTELTEYETADNSAVAGAGTGDASSADPVADRPTTEGQHAHSSGQRGSEIIGRALRLDSSSEAITSSEHLRAPSHEFEVVNTWRAKVGGVVENRLWQILFMGLTFYALFSSDADQLVGTKESKFNLAIATTVVFFLFALELILQSVGKPGYLFRSYFWLDLVALISLLPDTWLVQIVFSNSQFVAARSSKMSRIIRVASRSTKATRLNRLARIVRIAALLPRLFATYRKRQKQDEVEIMLEKKLQQLFLVLDDDRDGYISQESLLNCLDKFRLMPGVNSSTGGLRRAFTSGRSLAAGTPTASAGASPSSAHSVASTTATTSQVGVLDGDPVNLRDFSQIVMEDQQVRQRLILACKQQVARSNNMQNLAARHSEDLGVKVALGVLVLILVLSFVEPANQDRSNVVGLQMLQTAVNRELANNWTSGVWPNSIQQQVAVWQSGAGGRNGKRRQILYLDLQYRVFCNSLVPGGPSCDIPLMPNLRWTPRKSMDQIDRDLKSSSFRLPGDVEILRLPTTVDDNSDKLDIIALNRTVTAVAIVNARAAQETEARTSLLTTGVVIIVILLGIVLLTKDMTYLSRSLLKPLRTLASEMRAIVHLQLAALEQDDKAVMHITAEINLIQKIFDNMKKAIRSWGKYVPWPVVQILLQAGVDAKTGVREREVTMFFSDIAGFTTIVEKLPPEMSLLLLSKYFNDMSRVIDDHGGIVIEFIGDAIFSVYGSPAKDADHPSSGVRATLRMLQVLDKLNEWGREKNLPEVNIRCGVHTGMVLIGNMGFNSRMKYGCVGENANIPGRLEELNKAYGTPMLISHSTFKRLKKGAFVVRLIDFVYVRAASGVSEPVFQVMAKEKHKSPHKLTSVAKLHTKGMEHYRRCQFQKAADAFAKVNAQMQELTGVESDTASVTLMKRSLAYLKSPPRADWDGVWDQPTEPP